jgi:hypothetical protein
MRRYYKDVAVQIDLDDFEDDELLDELEERGVINNNHDKDLLNVIKISLDSIWMKRRVGQDYQKELDDLMYYTLGKVV